MDYRLLIDIGVLDFLRGLRGSRRRQLLLHFREIQDYPERHSDFIDRDNKGRRIDVSVFDGLAVYYWIDSADMDIKVVKVVPAD